jgi:predicted GNAT superfamily acetyltransferase
VVRSCRGLDELRACVALQKEVWNFSDADLVPLRMFVVAEKIGGQIVGGFQGDQLAAFALSIPGVRAGKPYLHSHMLAVREEFRNAGLGRRLKLFQREEALNRGFDLMEWTFDPLEIKNSYFNIEGLGAIARRYAVNQYGISSSPLQGGLPTDRLVAEWWLNSPRVAGAVQRRRTAPAVAVKAIEVSAEIYEWKASPAMRSRAKEIQDRNRKEFLSAFAAGLAIVGYERDQIGNGKFLLGHWDGKDQRKKSSAIKKDQPKISERP